MAKGSISNPGPDKSFSPIGKTPSGKQDQGSAENVMNYCDVNVGLAGGTTISTEMTNPLGKTPTGKKSGGL